MSTAFAKQTPQQKRVTIARDVLKWLNSGKLVAKAGTYLELSDHGRPVTSNRVNGYKCKACAIGAVFAAAAERGCGHGSLDVPRFSMVNRLASFFPEEQLHAMENAFEQRTVTVGVGGASEYKTASDTRRMRAIMQNIIRNKGEFVLRHKSAVNELPRG